MKETSFSLLILTAVLFLSSCSGSKKVAYFQNIDKVDLAASRGLYDAHIMPKDLLNIIVNTTDPQAAAPFNLGSGTFVGTDNQKVIGNVSALNYLVDNKGDINFPVIGKVHVGGLTKGECEDLIRNRLVPYLAKTENPVVTVRMASFHVTVAGEVRTPGVFPVTTEKMSIIEALAQAGDLTIYGKRDNVILLREKADGEKEYHRLNLNDANLINSPYYYLQQNDVLYVEPNKVQSQNSSIGNSTTLWFSFVGIVTSVASLLVNVLR